MVNTETANRAGIRVRDITREFKRQRRRPGLGGAVRGLFAPEYDVLTAVDHISFDIEPGEVVGYIGPNGAGKSTTIKMLVGILVPTGGEVSVGGIVPHRQRMANARNIGVVFGQRTQLWWDIPVSDTFTVMRHMYGIPLQDYERALQRFFDILAIDEFMDVAVRQLSLGQRMRADFCCAIPIPRKQRRSERPRWNPFLSRRTARTGQRNRDGSGPARSPPSSRAAQLGTLSHLVLWTRKSDTIRRRCFPFCEATEPRDLSWSCVLPRPLFLSFRKTPLN